VRGPSPPSIECRGENLLGAMESRAHRERVAFAAACAATSGVSAANRRSQHLRDTHTHMYTYTYTNTTPENFVRSGR